MGRRPVRQRGKNDCCVAAVANAAGVSYAAVKKALGTYRRGLEGHELGWLLSEFGTWHEVRPRRPPLVSEWLPRHPSGRFVLVLHSGFLLDQGHAIAAVDGVVMGEYAESWPVVRYFMGVNND